MLATLPDEKQWFLGSSSVGIQSVSSIEFGEAIGKVIIFAPGHKKKYRICYASCQEEEDVNRDLGKRYAQNTGNAQNTYLERMQKALETSKSSIIQVDTLRTE